MNRLLRIASRSKLRLTAPRRARRRARLGLGAFGYYTSAGAGTGSAIAGNAQPADERHRPGLRQRGRCASRGHASVAGPGAIAPTGYYAERKAGGPAWAPACDSSPSALVGATDCDDTVSADGDCIYRVTAVYRCVDGDERHELSAVHVVVDSAPPTSTISFPGAGPYSEAGWNAAARRRAAGDMLRHARTILAPASPGFRSRSSAPRTASTGTAAAGRAPRPGTTRPARRSWSYALGAGDLDDGVSYTVRSRAIDNAGNTQTTPDSKTFDYDSTAPSVTVERSAGQSDSTNSLPMRWAVSFTEPVTGFDASDVTRGGTSTGGTVSVTGSGASYEISLAGHPDRRHGQLLDRRRPGRRTPRATATHPPRAPTTRSPTTRRLLR